MNWYPVQTAQQNRMARSWSANARPSHKMQNSEVSQTSEPLDYSSHNEFAELSCIHSQSQLDLHQPSIRMGIFAIPPQLTVRSSWELHECNASVLVQKWNVQLIPCASQMSMSSCRPEPQQPHMRSTWRSNCISIAKIFRLS